MHTNNMLFEVFQAWPDFVAACATCNSADVDPIAFLKDTMNRSHVTIKVVSGGEPLISSAVSTWVFLFYSSNLSRGCTG